MTQRKLNFSAGPAVMPVPVLEEARENLLSLGETGVGIMEHSHRGAAFVDVLDRTTALAREVGGIGDDFDVLYLQGGASTQFFMVPMNFLSEGETADYLNTGSWSQKAIKEAKRFGNVHEASSSAEANFNYVPQADARQYSDDPRYVHFTSNNTIFGTQYASEPDAPSGVKLVCDASSDIYSRPIAWDKYGLLYAGAQKNLGPAGVTLVVVRKDWVSSGKSDLPSMLAYKTHAEKDSCYNTPPTFGIYLMGLVFQWIKDQGGLAEMQKKNARKSGLLYDFLDQSSLFSGTAREDSRSAMNVTFVTGDDETNTAFIKAAETEGLSGLKGHRSVGGMRASIYNAFPEEGVKTLVEFMREFERTR